jgi:hypothetical protein
VAGDTIYVNPSTSVYSENVIIPRRLVLVGGGYKSSNQLNFRTEVNALTLNSTGTNNPSGTVITGFLVNNISFSGTVNPINDIQIFRNRVGTISLQGNHWLIYNNILASVAFGTLPIINNIRILNNIFSGGFLQSGTSSTVVVDHNIFLRTSGQHLNNMKLATFTNNIFLFSGSGVVIDAGTENNNFNNNLSLLTTVSVTAPTNSFAGGPNTEAGNFVGINPTFVNVTNFGAYDENANYRLQTSSPVRNAGTDGTDLGIYGGSYPFPSGGAPGGGFDTSALPPVPQVTALNVENGTLAPGTQLRVRIQATTNN